MEAILNDYTPEEIEGLLEEMFEGYIQSEYCCSSKLYDMYTLKKMIVKQAKLKSPWEQSQ